MVVALHSQDFFPPFLSLLPFGSNHLLCFFFFALCGATIVRQKKRIYMKKRMGVRWRWALKKYSKGAHQKLTKAAKKNQIEDIEQRIK